MISVGCLILITSLLNYSQKFNFLFIFWLTFEEKSLKSIYFAYIHLYLNDAKITWVLRTYKTKLETIHFYQKRAVPFVFNEGKVTHFRPLLQLLNTFKVFTQ